MEGELIGLRVGVENRPVLDPGYQMPDSRHLVKRPGRELDMPVELTGNPRQDTHRGHVSLKSFQQ